MAWTDEHRKTVEGQGFRVKRDEDGTYITPLRGDKGNIGWHGSDKFMAYIRPQAPLTTIKTIKRKCPGAELHQHGDNEITVLHPVSGWREFFRACGAKTKRVMTEDEKIKMSENLGEHRGRIGNLAASATR